MEPGFPVSTFAAIGITQTIVWSCGDNDKSKARTAKMGVIEGKCTTDKTAEK